TPQAQGGTIPSLWALANHMFFIDDIPLIGKLLPSTQHTGKSGRAQKIGNNELIPMGWVGGTALFANKQMLTEIGSFDENIFMYGEDIELCMRAHRHHWDVAIHPAAKIIHLQNQSSSSKNAVIGELLGYLYIWSKHKPLWQMNVARFILSLGCLLRFTIFDTILPDEHKAVLYREALHEVRQYK
ncbi:glycosyltransferase, partial [Candidatus Woesebacteria bacterium]|nr:glycosyltransferase [Candidatus Woesebacteria bacterium]